MSVHGPRCVLVFDTAAPVLGVALWVDGQVTSRTERIVGGSERRLVPLAAALLEEAGLSNADIDAVGVANGPGAFTGLRVGIATAAGLAQAAGCPLAVVSSLESRAQAASIDPGDELVVMLDARKGRVYAQRFRGGAAIDDARDIDPNLALSDVEPGFWATGEGALVYREHIEARSGRLVPRPDEPGVGALASLTVERILAGHVVAPSEVHPTYLREPDAVLRRRS